MEKKIFELLNEVGCPCHIKGREYIETAVKIALEKGIVQMTKELYPTIAEIHKTTATRVERAISRAVDLCFLNGDYDTIKRVFGSTINLNNGKMVNSAFIYGIAKYLKVYCKENDAI